MIDPTNAIDQIADLVIGKDKILSMDVPVPDGAQVIDCEKNCNSRLDRSACTCVLGRHLSGGKARKLHR